MRSIFLSILFVISLIFNTNAQKSVTNAEVSFVFVSKDVKGTIGGFKSSSTIDFDTHERSSFEGSVAVETLDTNNGLRNWSLKNGKYFDEDDFPRISFKSTAVNYEDGIFIVKGDLSIKGTTKPIVINFRKNGNQLKGETSIYSYDYGIKIKRKREDNLVKIEMLFEIE